MPPMYEAEAIVAEADKPSMYLRESRKLTEAIATHDEILGMLIARLAPIATPERAVDPGPAVAEINTNSEAVRALQEQTERVERMTQAVNDVLERLDI